MSTTRERLASYQGSGVGWVVAGFVFVAVVILAFLKILDLRDALVIAAICAIRL